MELQADHRLTISQPKDTEIREQLTSMRECVILSRSNLSFLRACRDGQGFRLELQVGSIDNHVRMERTVELDEAARILSHFCQHENDWSNRTRWTELAEAKPRQTRKILWLVLFATALTFFIESSCLK